MYMTLAQTIKQARLTIGLSKAELARRAGVSYAYVAQIERGERLISPDMMTPKLAKILEVLNIDPREVIPKRQLRVVGVTWKVKGPTLPEGLEPVRLIPVLGKTAAGDPQDFTNSDYPPGFADDYIPCPIDVKDPDAFALRLKGDSMVPRFPDRTIVVCAPSLQLENGQPVVAKSKDEHTACKIFYRKGDQVNLISINPKFHPITLHASELEWAYRVVKSVKNEE